MKNNPVERALEVCVQQMSGGASSNELLDLYPQFSSELSPLLQTIDFTQQVTKIIKVNEHRDTSQQAKEHSLVSLLDAFENVWQPKYKRKKFTQIILSGIFILILLAFGFYMVFNFIKRSDQIFPGDANYPLKLAWENARLFLARTPGDKLELQYRNDQERLKEISQLLQAKTNWSSPQQGLAVQFTGLLGEVQPGTWRVGPFDILVPDDTQLVGSIQPGIAVQINGYLEPGGILLARTIRPQECEITGRLIKVNGNLWFVDDAIFSVTKDTIITGINDGKPNTGSTIKAKVFWLADQHLQARYVEVQTGK